MAIISIPPREIFPTKPRTAWLSQGGTQNQYNTVLEVTNGRGIINVIYGTTYDTSYYTTETQFRITVDGVETVIVGTYPEMIAVMPSVKNERQVVLNNPFYFYKSVKIEITNNWRAYNAFCTIQYALE